MLIMAEKARYVQVPEYSNIKDSLAESAANIEVELESAREAKALHINKHESIGRAQELIDEISKDIARFGRLVPIKQPEKKPRAAAKSVIGFARPMRPIMTEDDREMIARSHRALENLQRNLSELKSELGKA